ncbi:hypothetical protein [Pseudaestuariivita atlantica]|uniref:Ferrochelatase n=1 Tax=Pseudaestuariivita atlantica TaxID=1317121 RepID=A0A0L1JM90_9RHOB|nr:hypothetical protein [Pseudaestuariivita atlantica]KNG92874.1 hypothetical protein ATO11_15565 [Pseudaestuariivita atlantica]
MKKIVLAAALGAAVAAPGWADGPSTAVIDQDVIVEDATAQASSGNAEMLVVFLTIAVLGTALTN